MKTMLKNMLGGAALGLALLAHTAPTWAGLKLNAEVFVGSNSASGSLTSARYSDDNQQYITCYTLAGGTNVLCTAKNKTGASLSCVTYNPILVSRVSAITDSSLITFGVASNSQTCLTLYVNNSSYNLK